MSNSTWLLAAEYRTLGLPADPGPNAPTHWWRLVNREPLRPTGPHVRNKSLLR
jgi:hypothetical protein